jgi:hypothetical protein
MILGTISAIINGTSIPLCAFIASKLYGNFITADPNKLV